MISNDDLQNFENINGFSEKLLLKLINYSFNNNFNFNNSDIEILNSERKINEVNIKVVDVEYLLFIDYVDSDFKSEVCDLMIDTQNFSDEFKHNLLLAINNLIGMAKLVFHAIKDRYINLLSNFDLVVSPELTLYFDEAVDKRLCIRLIKK